MYYYYLYPSVLFFEKFLPKKNHAPLWSFPYANKNSKEVAKMQQKKTNWLIEINFSCKNVIQIETNSCTRNCGWYRIIPSPRVEFARSSGVLDWHETDIGKHNISRETCSGSFDHLSLDIKL